MRVLQARNVHQAFPLALRLLAQEGIERESRNGRVRVTPFPVTTVYEQPCERVIFWWKRDANPFFHLYESLWMLAGRNDVAGVAKYAKNMESFSDDGETLHGAYGYRWRKFFGLDSQWSPTDRKPFTDQLHVIVASLKKNADDRRAVLQMWDATNDLGKVGKDVPCNLTATFQRDAEGKLDLTVFCRSNDIVWGAYGANAVHFSFLLEYMALAIGCPVGVYRQVSVNWHGYLTTLPGDEFWKDCIDRLEYVQDPYTNNLVYYTPMTGTLEATDREILRILTVADSGKLASSRKTYPIGYMSTWGHTIYLVLEAHEQYRRVDRSKDMRLKSALDTLAEAPSKNDWVRAATEWLSRRSAKV